VKEKEFVNVSEGLTIKFNWDGTQADIFTTIRNPDGSRTGLCFRNRPATVNNLQRTISFSFNRNQRRRQDYLLKSITTDSFLLDRTIVDISVRPETIERSYTDLYFIQNIRTGGTSLTCTATPETDDYGYLGTHTVELAIGGNTYQASSDPDTGGTLTIHFEDGLDELYLSTPTKGCKKYTFTLVDRGNAIEFVVSEVGSSGNEAGIRIQIKKYKIFINTNPFTIQYIDVTFSDSAKTQVFSTNSQSSLVPLLQIQTPFDATQCKGLACGPNEIPYCEDGTSFDVDGKCFDGRYSACLNMCSDPASVCASPFTKIKFASENEPRRFIVKTD
jgi:hypothetical protein